jgi:hypothetical protein
MPRNETQARSCSRGRQACCSSSGVERRAKSSHCGGRQDDELLDDDANWGPWDECCSTVGVSSAGSPFSQGRWESIDTRQARVIDGD